jgi:hypothetical protein
VPSLCSRMPSRLEYNTDHEGLREDLISFLSSMEIKWPHVVKLSPTALQKRMITALDYAQNWEGAPKHKEKKKISFRYLRPYRLCHSEHPIHQGARRLSIEEMTTMSKVEAEASPETILNQLPHSINPFVGLRRVYDPKLL